MYMLKRVAKVNFNKSGSGSTSCKVIIPAEFCKVLDIKEGDKIEFTMSSQLGFSKSVTIKKIEGVKNE